jgi:hypothetical protein
MASKTVIPSYRDTSLNNDYTSKHQENSGTLTDYAIQTPQIPEEKDTTHDLPLPHVESTHPQNM